MKCTLFRKVETDNATKLCDSCWELNRRVASQPKLAIKILKNLKKIPRKSTLTKKEKAVAALMDIGWKRFSAEEVVYGGQVMLSENYIKQQLKAQELLDKQYQKIAAIAEKYGGTAWVVFDSIEVSIPKESIKAAMKEINECAC
jgi:hypothetical protein